MFIRVILSSVFRGLRVPGTTDSPKVRYQFCQSGPSTQHYNSYAMMLSIARTTVTSLLTAGIIAAQQMAEHKTSTADIVFRVGIPETSQSPFSVFVSITAPKLVGAIGAGWVGLSFGGEMLYNPLVVAWQHDEMVLVSARWAT
jgi:hypothetical protein